MIKFGKEWQIPIFSEEEGKRRHRLIKDLMDFRGINCLIIAGTTANYKAGYADIRYISQFINWFDDEYCVFPLEGEAVLYVWMWQHEYWAKRVSWIPIETTGAALGLGSGYAEYIIKKIKKMGLEKSTIGIVTKKTMPVYIYEALKEGLPEAKFVEAGDILFINRLYKSPEEVEFVRKAGECADIGFKAMVNAAKPGITNYELIAECEAAMIKAGAEVGSFTLFDTKQWPNGWGFPYGGNMRKLQKGDIILNEITPCFGGYYVQLCRPICLGKPPADFVELYEIHREMYRIARNDLRPGNVRREIDAKVAKYAMSKKNFTWASPIIQCMDSIVAPNFRAALAPGQVFQIHPFTNPSEPDMQAMKGHMGHIIGDTCIVTEDEPECVSKLPFELTIV